MARCPDPPADLKTCRRCKTKHPRNHFPHGGLRCRRCHHAFMQQQRWDADVERNRAKARERYHRQKGPQRRRGYNLRARHGITAAEYDRMLEEQGRKCAICRREPRGKRGLMVDHKHGTDPMLVRALLCQLCNTTIGAVKESAEILRAMARYVERWERKGRKAEG